MARQGNLIPLYQEFLADTETPVSAYLKMKDQSFSYLLESAGNDNRRGRYSFLGYKPSLVMISRSEEVVIQEQNCERTLKDVENPLTVLRDLIKEFRPVTIQDLSPFQGGFVGYCNYDIVRKWEHLHPIGHDGSTYPEAIFAFCRRLIIFDHLTHRIKAVAFAYLKGNENLRELYDSACQAVHETVNELRHPRPILLENDIPAISPMKAYFARKDFEEAVRHAKDHIAAGDAIQVVLSNPVIRVSSGDPEGNLYDQCHRVVEHVSAQGDEEPRLISQ